MEPCKCFPWKPATPWNCGGVALGESSSAATKAHERRGGERAAGRAALRGSGSISRGNHKVFCFIFRDFRKLVMVAYEVVD